MQSPKCEVRTNTPFDWAVGQLARFVTELDWDTPPDFSSFLGTLTIEGSGQLAAVAILETPGQYATLPVIVD